MAAANKLRYAEGVALVQVVGFDVNGAVCALGKSFADGGADALGPCAEHDDFAAVLLPELQRFFQCVGVRLVHGVLQVGLFDPFSGAVDADLRIALGDLFDGYDDFHAE